MAMEEIAVMVLGLLIAVGAGVGISLGRLTARRRHEHLLGRKKTPISRLRDGQAVTILGIAHAEPSGTPLLAPTSRRQCIAWWHSHNHLGWLKVTTGCGTFVVRDGTGEALVLGDDRTLLYLDPETACKESPIIVEHVLEKGERVAVAGTARVLGGGESGHRGVRRVEIHAGGKNRPLVVSSEPRYVTLEPVKRSR